MGCVHCGADAAATTFVSFNDTMNIKQKLWMRIAGTEWLKKVSGRVKSRLGLTASYPTRRASLGLVAPECPKLRLPA